RGRGGRRPGRRRDGARGQRHGHRDAPGRDQRRRGPRRGPGRVRLRRHRGARRRHGAGGGRMSTTTNTTASVLLGWLEPFRSWLDSLGPIGTVLWLVLLILAIAVPVIISVAFYVVWERNLIGWMHVRHRSSYVGLVTILTVPDHYL